MNPDLNSSPIDPETAARLATDPAVRAAVLATVTLQEAARAITTPAGKPWCQATLLRFTDGLDEMLGEGTAINASAREVIGVAPKTAAKTKPAKARRAASRVS